MANKALTQKQLKTFKRNVHDLIRESFEERMIEYGCFWIEMATVRLGTYDDQADNERALTKEVRNYIRKWLADDVASAMTEQLEAVLMDMEEAARIKKVV